MALVLNRKKIHRRGSTHGMTDDEQIEIIRKCAADIWENAAKIAGNYKLQTRLDIHIRIRYGSMPPEISVHQTFIPQGVIKWNVLG